MILQTNCSEATLRIRVDDLEENELEQIMNMLEMFDRIVNSEETLEATNDNRNIIDENAKLCGDQRPIEITEERINEIKDKWYDTYFTLETIFGMRVIVIRGNTPYNNGDWLLEQLKSFSFSSKLDFDESEP